MPIITVEIMTIIDERETHTHIHTHTHTHTQTHTQNKDRKEEGGRSYNERVRAKWLLLHVRFSPINM